MKLSSFVLWVVFASGALLAQPAVAAMRADVPVPRPKPALDKLVPDKLQVKPSRQDESKIVVPSQTRPVYDVDVFKACVAELEERDVEFEILPPRIDLPPCGVTRPIRVTRLSSKTEISGSPVLNCAMVLALDNWVDSGVSAAASNLLNDAIATIEVSTTYQCRRRNNAGSGKFSEHAFGNGIDVLAFESASGLSLPVQPHSDGDEEAARFQAAIRSSACEHFTTVLGPGSNAAHANHFHLDLAIRRGGYRLCE